MATDGDGVGLRGVAAAARALADDLGAEAADVVAAAESVAWEGLAADAARATARAGADRLDRTVRALLDAAAAVDRHADAVGTGGGDGWWPW